LLHKQMQRKGRAIAGRDFAEAHELSFMEVRSIAKRTKLDDDDNDSSLADPNEPGLEDIVTMAFDVARLAGECAAEAVPPKLPSE
jgi:hypothetical protein